MSNVDNRPYVANLDFDSIKADIIEHYKSKPEFKDYDFTGSALNVLIDMLAYNTHYNALSANFLVNEMFLDSAVVRSNVVSIAKQLNYIPRSARACTATIVVTVPRINQEQFFLIPAGSRFISSASPVGNQKSFTFYTLEDTVVQFEAGDTSKDATLTIYEGRLSTTRFIADEDNIETNRFLLAADNIDETTIRLRVNNNTYERVTPEKEGVLRVENNSRVYWIEENRTRQMDIIFGNDVVGLKLQPKDEIVASYLITNGDEATGISSFYANVPNRPDIRIKSVTGNASGGAGRESINEIKDNAPHWYQSQYRAVTENDYEALIRKNYADIQSINVYGGDTTDDLGAVYISIKPKSGDKLTDSAKTALLNNVVKASNVLTVRPKIIDPLILKLVIKSTVVYDSAITTATADIIAARIYKSLELMNTTYVGDFLESFRESNLSYQIRGADDSIVSSNSRVTLRYDQVAGDGVVDLYTWSYGNKIFHPEDGFKNTTGGVFYTNTFNKVGELLPHGFDDDGYGNIRLYKLSDETKIYVSEQAGRIDYETGQIEILLDFNPVAGQTISFYAIPDSVDVITDKNTILQIAADESAVQVLDKNAIAAIKSTNLTRSF